MGYKERLKDYTEGKLEGKEKDKVESDIDRQRAIGEYLDEKADSGIFEESKDAEEKQVGKDGELSKLVQKAVSGKLKKFAIWTGAIVLAISLFLMFGLSPLMDAMYYDPGKTLSEENMCSIIDPAMHVFAELRCTGKSFTGSESRDEGFGRYSVTLYFLSQLYGSERYDVIMDKGVFSRRYAEWVQSYPLVYFTRDSGHMSTETIDDSEDIAEIRKLPETALVTACFNFKEDINLNEIKNLDPDRKWIEYVVIRVSDEYGDMRGGYFGYSTLQPMFPWFVEAYDKEKYPDLNLADQWPYIPEKTWESHFKSMLKYLADQKDLNKALGSKPEIYTDALQYVEKNGIKAYGAIITAPVNGLLTLRQDSRVQSMFVIDAKLSRFGDLQLYKQQ